MKSAFETPFPAGHFYSPLPSTEELDRDRDRIFGNPPKEIPGISMNDKLQNELIKAFSSLYYNSMPFVDGPTEELRYGFKNGAYSYTDAIFLHCMIRHFRPKRIIEVGSGHSSCLTFDTNQHFFANSIKCTFIEPYPKLLKSLLKPADIDTVEIIEKRVQEVSLKIFDELSENDILFIDSTHVSKAGSDVNHLFFEVLPRLKTGVLVHFHDIFYPFEYPERWLRQGRAWNENYLLRAFLQFNSRFEVILFANYLATFYREDLVRLLPKCRENLGGNIWIRSI